MDQFLREDPRDLEQLIAAWISSIPCELNNEGLMCQPEPVVIPPPSGEGASGRRPVTASEGGDQYWSIGAYAETEPSAGGLASVVGCIEVKMMCYLRTVRLPAFALPDDGDEDSEGKRGVGAADGAGDETKKRIVGPPTRGSSGTRMWSDDPVDEWEFPRRRPRRRDAEWPETLRFWAAASAYDQVRRLGESQR